LGRTIGIKVQVTLREEGKSYDGYWRDVLLPVVPLVGDFVDLQTEDKADAITVLVEERYLTSGSPFVDLSVLLNGDPPERLGFTWEDFGFSPPESEPEPAADDIWS
jgi:hypothetical protein